MENLKDLEELVGQLNEEGEKIKKLQEILKVFLNNYYIELGQFIIDPLLVEIYYNSVDFPDNSVYAANKSTANTYALARQRQKKHIGELYVHYGTKDGIDIVLSNGDYYLSILIKNALIRNINLFQDSIFAKQCKISEMLCVNCDEMAKCNKGINCRYYGKKVLKPVQKNDDIIFVKRKGIKNSFSEEPLASLPINKIRDYPFTLGESITSTVKKYIEKLISTKEYDEEKLKKLAKGLISWKKFEML